MARGDAARLVAHMNKHQNLASHARELRELQGFDADAALKFSLLSTDVNSGWLIWGGIMVFFMHAGFAFLEGGCVKPRNRQSILLKNISCMALSAFAWFMFGFGFATGEDSADKVEGGGLMGTDRFFAGNDNMKAALDYNAWFFQWTFCATASTIVSGALAERVHLIGFLIFSFYLTAFTYPCVVHWTWFGGFFKDLGSQEGVDQGQAAGYSDFAGSGVVHLFGGVCALCAAIIAGPRIGRFEQPEEYAASNPLLVLMGCFFLWFGWYGFNGASTGGLSGGGATVAARCCITTTCAAAAGGLTMMLFPVALGQKNDLAMICNGVLGGLVGITAGCSNAEPIIAFLIGTIGALAMYGATKLLEKLKIDDPIGAFPVHGAAGFWGVIAAGLFDLDRGLFYIDTEVNKNGLFWPNLLGAFIIALWAIGTSVPILLPLKMVGMLRVSAKVEKYGIDRHEFVKLCVASGKSVEEQKADTARIAAGSPDDDDQPLAA